MPKNGNKMKMKMKIKHLNGDYDCDNVEIDSTIGSACTSIESAWLSGMYGKAHNV